MFLVLHCMPLEDGLVLTLLNNHQPENDLNTFSKKSLHVYFGCIAELLLVTITSEDTSVGSL